MVVMDFLSKQQGVPLQRYALKADTLTAARVDAANFFTIAPGI